MQDPILTPLNTTAPVEGGGINPNSLQTDFSASESYASRQDNANDNYGFDPEIVKQMQKNEQRMNQPNLSEVTNAEWYPNANRGIEVGSISTPMGGMSLLASGFPLIPFAVNEQAKAQAIEKAKIENQELLAGSTWDYVKTKDELRQNHFNKLQDYQWGGLLKKYQDKYGALMGTKLAFKSQEAKETAIALQNYGKNVDEMYDVATDALMNFQRQQMGGVSTTTEKHKDPVTGIETVAKTTDGSAIGKGGKQYVEYVSPTTAQRAKEYLDGISRRPEDMTLNDIKDFNPQTYIVTAKGMDKAIQDFWDNGQVNADISTHIFSEAQAGKMGKDDMGNLTINGKLATDKNNIAYIVKTSGWDSERINRVAQSIYDTNYANYEQLYGKEKAKEYVPSVSEIEKNLQGYIYQQTTADIKEIAKMSPEEWARTKQIKQSLIPDVIPKTVIDFTGKEAKTWDLRDKNLIFKNDAHRAVDVRDVNGKITRTTFLPNQNFIVTNVKTRKNAKGNDEPYGTIVPITTTYVDDGYGNQIPQENADYSKSYEVPYNIVKSTVETNYGTEQGKTLKEFPFGQDVSWAERENEKTPQTKTATPKGNVR